MISGEPKDLSGDPVYEHLKKFILKGFSLVGGRIVDLKTAGPKQARKLIEIHVMNEKTKQINRFSYNYKRIERDLK